MRNDDEADDFRRTQLRTLIVRARLFVENYVLTLKSIMKNSQSTALDWLPVWMRKHTLACTEINTCTVIIHTKWMCASLNGLTWAHIHFALIVCRLDIIVGIFEYCCWCVCFDTLCVCLMNTSDITTADVIPQCSQYQLFHHLNFFLIHCIELFRIVYIQLALINSNHNNPSNRNRKSMVVAL